MKKTLLPLLILLGAGITSFAQTAGEKESYETMKSAANLYLENGDYAAAKAQYEGIFKLYRQYENFTKEIRSDYEKCLREIDKAAALLRVTPERTPAQVSATLRQWSDQARNNYREAARLAALGK